MTNDQVLGAIKESVTYAKKFTDDVEWSCEDGTRTDLDFMYKTIELAINCGATTINIPDTVGYSIPEEFAKKIESIKNNVPNIDKAIISAHCHNDLGLAVANALSGLSAGVRQIECTINGIGERAGNAALEEIVMAIKTRDDLLPYETGIKTELISKASKIVSNATGFPVQYNKAIVGKNAFAHESGIHQDGMLKNRETYEIMTPESVGVKQTSLVMGKHSGRHAFKDKLSDLGYKDITDDVIQIAFGKFKVLADKKKHIYDEDIAALVDDSLIREDNVITLKSLKVFAGTGEPQKADMTLEVYGEIKKATDPIYQKISKVVPEIEWSIHAPYIHKINKLKKEKNAVILAHNYQTPEIYHGISDFSADSLALAVEAAKTKADIIIMCGVHFMAETAKLMSPNKKVLLPDMKAGCSLSSSITGKDVRLLKEKYPGVPVVSYVNTNCLNLFESAHG